VDFFCGPYPSASLTLFAKRMGFDVPVSDALPGPAVALVGIRISLVLVVASCYHLLVLGAVLSTRCKPTAAWVSTRASGFVWHGFTSFLRIRKALVGWSQEGFFTLQFLNYIVLKSSTALKWIYVDFAILFQVFSS